jgi:energy-coupling factor transporter ATP-binding protein EcfA2
MATEAAPPLVLLENVSRCVRAGTAGCSADARALDDVSLAVRAEEIVLLAGRRGSGKTTLLHCAAGAMLPDAGRVTWAGSPVPPPWIALAGATDLDQAAPTVGEAVEETIGSAQPVWMVDALVARAMTWVGLELRRSTRLGALLPRERTQLRIARAVARTVARASEVRLLLVDASAERETFSLEARDVAGLARRLGCALVAAAPSLGGGGCAVDRRLVLEHGRLLADLRHAPPLVATRNGEGSPGATPPADVDPLPALL